MCSLHPRVLKKVREGLDEIIPQITTEVTDTDLFNIKSIKRKAADELTALKGCAVSENLLKIFNSPTPSAKNVPMMQKHLEDILRQLRR